MTKLAQNWLGKTYFLLCFGMGANAAVAEPCQVCGTWALVDRIDRAANGAVIPEATLGQHPVGILFYDAAGNVSVQLMKPDRATTTSPVVTSASPNNTGTGNGYDAYFGKYKIDYAKQIVTHELKGTILPADVGKSIVRTFAFEKGDLVLSFHTENGGVPVLRSLRWRKVAGSGQ